MKSFILVSILAIVSLPSAVWAQRCPRSVRTIKVFVPNDSKATNLRYEIFPIHPKGATQREAYDFVMKSLRLDPYLVDSTIESEHMAEVHPDLAEPFMKTYDRTKYETNEEKLNNRNSGEIHSGTLLVNATDLVSFYYLLRITSNEFRTGYFVGNLMGGCGEFDRLLLEWPKAVGKS